jgi:hypothetical protein
MSRNVNISPDFIAASTPSELRRLLYLNQVTLGGEVKYISILHDGNQWVAWFFNDVSDMPLTDSVVKKAK